MIEEFMTVKGWEVKENKAHRVLYTGYFRSGSRQWQGKVLITQKDNRVIVKPFILDPPAEIKHLPQGSCFRQANDEGWFEVHWEKAPDSASSCVAYLEELFTRALSLTPPVPVE